MNQARTPETDLHEMATEGAFVGKRGDGRCVTCWGVVPATISRKLERHRDALLANLRAALPYLEGLSEKLKIASNAPEVALLNGQIASIKAALQPKEDK